MNSTKRMRIIIDLQGAQTQSRFRGIGRYTMALTQAILRVASDHDIHLVLSGLIPETIEPITKLLQGRIARSNIHVWYAPNRVSYQNAKNTLRQQRAQKIYSHFLLGLKPDVVLITSLFEGYSDDAVTCITPLADKVPCAVIFYDLIPLLNPTLYLDSNPLFAEFYRDKIAQLEQAQMWLAISESVAQEGMHALGLPGTNVVNISAACDALFYPRTFSPQEASTTLQAFGIVNSFILYTGGSDVRKNLPRLIRAYVNLPELLKNQYQLVFAGEMPAGNFKALQRTINEANLPLDRVCFTGYISDEQLANLYSLCALFVMPSLHEGFGLPPLEAMACGAVVIAANTTSLPEVIGEPSALFDPYDEVQISQKMELALTDESLRTHLRSHGLAQAQKFSWDKSATRTVRALEKLVVNGAKPSLASIHSMSLKADVPIRKRLAFVAPLPPARTGIADYSALLLPYLATYYEIVLVMEQSDLDFSTLPSGIEIRDAAWLRRHGAQCDRVLYHMGNSAFHTYMLDLMEQVPGVVMLHDFFLSGLLAYLELAKGVTQVWNQSLYHSHGYLALQARYAENGIENARTYYPVNFSVLENARGVIVHSPYSVKLAQDWYGDEVAGQFTVIPLLRVLTPQLTQEKKNAIRQVLGLAPDDFVVCSFGFLDPTKLNDKLLESWLDSNLADDPHCQLIFVGENHGAEYGKKLLETIAASRCADRIRITGWVSSEQYENYLAIADSAVQLRTCSRGETSAAVLDCLAHGLPTIVNANGSMAYLPQSSVILLPDEFDSTQLPHALERLRSDRNLRQGLTEHARATIAQEHCPERCARLYYEAIEQFEQAAQYGTAPLIGQLRSKGLSQAERDCLADSISRSFAFPRPAKQLFLDISATCAHDLKTGIERVTRALVISLLQLAPKGYRIEPVYLEKKKRRAYYRYARNYTLDLLNCPDVRLEDDIVEPQAGDIMLSLDLSGDRLISASQSGLYQEYRQRGVLLYAVVYDLLPLQMPQYFPAGASDEFAKWLGAVTRWDGALCISHTVAQDLQGWVKQHAPDYALNYCIQAFTLGSDLAQSKPSVGMPDGLLAMQVKLESALSFLMVGTIEPRKGILQVLEAVSQLWEQGVAANLIIVGKLGWTSLSDDQRRTIPQIEAALRTHPMLGKQLFWFESASDEFLVWLYQHSNALICASEGEGLGLPLIEAARMGLPIIARDLPVFREVAKEGAYYFSADDAQALANAMQIWLGLYEQDMHPRSDAIKSASWHDSATDLLRHLLH